MSAWTAWVDLLDRREPGHALAAFRIAIGLCLVGSIGTVALHDLVGVIWLPIEHGGYRHLGGGSWLVRALGGPEPHVVNGLVTAGLVAGVSTALGLGSRLAPLVGTLCFQALVDLNGHTGGSYDELLPNALWLVVLADASRTWSLDCKLRTGAWSDPTPIPGWPRYLAILQLVLLYASTGTQKVSAYWTPVEGFSALWYILQQPSWHWTDMSWLAPAYPLTQAATVSVWLFELSSPLLLVVYLWRLHPERPGRLRAFVNRRDLRVPFAVFGLGMHLGIMATMNVGPFSPISMAFYLCLWHPDEWPALTEGSARPR